MARRQLKGKCTFCDGVFGRVAMKRHLLSCAKRPITKKKCKSFLILVSAGFYWIYVEIPLSSTLADLDTLLRRTWLECCGHLSAFNINGVSYTSNPSRDDYSEDESMDVKLQRLFGIDDKFSHEYDFGSTTDLVLKVVSCEENGGGDTRVLARNQAPVITCESCEKEEAKYVCPMCIYEDESWLCGKCSEDHECGEDMLLEIVNSPRTGVCGYEG